MIIITKKMVKLLPVDESQGENDSTIMNFEPSEEEAISLLIPKYVTSILYGALVGGPDATDNHNDVTKDWIYNEVTIVTEDVKYTKEICWFIRPFYKEFSNKIMLR